jgi:hypothetical protein
MVIHFYSPQDSGDTTQTAPSSTPYDTIWSTKEVPTKEPPPIERVMLAEDKLYVVLAVVLIIWFGLLFVLFRTNRRIRRLEQKHEDEV